MHPVEAVETRAEGEVCKAGKAAEGIMAGVPMGYSLTKEVMRLHVIIW